jgi:Methylamine utilisation protein MauE
VRWVLLAVQAGLAASLLVAATGKLVARGAFAATLRQSRLPDALAGPLGVVVPAVELALSLAVALGTGTVLSASLAATVALLAAFTAWLAWTAGRGLRIDCACFGPLSREVGPGTIARNVVLLGVAVGGLVLSVRTATPFSGPFLLKVMGAGAAGMTLALGVGLAAALPMLVLSRRKLEPPAEAAGEEG